MKDSKGRSTHDMHRILFEAALSFRLQKTLDAVKNNSTLANSRFAKEIYSGKKNPRKIASEDLVNLIAGYFSREDAPEQGLRQVNESYFSRYFESSFNIFQASYFSLLVVDRDNRLVQALRYSSLLSGWPIDVVKCAIKFREDEWCDYEKKDFDGIFNIKTGEEKKINWHLCLIQKPTLFWRRRFPFSPAEVFTLLDEKKIPKSLGPYSNARDHFLKGEISSFIGILRHLIDPQSVFDVDQIVGIAAHNLILVGIDSNDHNLIKEGIACIERLGQKRDLDVRDSRYSTAMAFGYLAIGNFDAAISAMVHTKDKDWDIPEYYGLTGSILSEAGLKKEAGKFYAMALKMRKTPSMWPWWGIRASLPQLTAKAEEQGVASTDDEYYLGWNQGESILSLIEKECPEIALDAAVTGRELLATIGSPTTDRVKKEEVKQHWRHFEEEIVIPEELSEELSTLQRLYQEILRFEKESKSLLSEGEYDSASSLIENMKRNWELVRLEINKTIEANLLGQEIKGKESLIRIIDGENKPPILAQALIELDSVLDINQRNRRKVAQEEITRFHNRLRAAGLDACWPSMDPGIEAFNEFRKGIIKELIKEESIADIQKGTMAISRFLSEIIDENQKVVIIQGLIQKIKGGLIFPSRSIVDFLSKFPGEFENPYDVLDAYCLCLESFDSRERSYSEAFRDTVIPFLFKIAGQMNDFVLGIIFRKRVLAELLLSHIDVLCLPKSKEIADRLFKDNERGDLLNLIASQSESTLLLELRKFIVALSKTCVIYSQEKLAKACAIWLEARIGGGKESIEANFDVVLALRDLLSRLERWKESIYFISVIWKMTSDRRIFQDFEPNLIRFITVSSRRDSRVREFALQLLENPQWLIEMQGGVLLFLYVCDEVSYPEGLNHLRNIFAYEYKEARKKYPVLIEEYFLKTRFGEKADDTVTEGRQEKIRALGKILWELDHEFELQSSYSSWYPAKDYQKELNRHLQPYRDELFKSRWDLGGKLIRSIEAKTSEEIFLDTEKTIRKRAQGSAKKGMITYLDEQIMKLKTLFILKEQLRIDDVREALSNSRKGIRERLEEEMQHLGSGMPPLLPLLYKIALENVA